MNFKLLNKERDKKIIKGIAVIVACVIAVLVLVEITDVKDEILFQVCDYDNVCRGSEQPDCNVAVINLHGDLYVDAIAEDGEISSTKIVDAIEKADKDGNIKAIILDINSHGGSPIAGEEIANAARRAEKPTVAVIRENGLSVAYWVATGADTIFASKNSDVGSIGVTMSYLDNSRKNEKEGLTYNQLSLGKFKDTFDPDKILTAEEKELAMRDLKIFHENFIKAVAENRELDIEKVRQLADGSSMLGEMAIGKGLIDHIGGLYEVEGYLHSELGEPAVVCGE